jgi:hypothetical protein
VPTHLPQEDQHAITAMVGKNERSMKRYDIDE